MNTNPLTIIGAGLAGLIAAHAWPTARIVELSPRPAAGHTALLRFRSDAVEKLTGIEFRRVRVRKGIFYKGGFIEPNIQLANFYAAKCTGVLAAERSIWNVEPVDRYVAPPDFYQQLIDAVGSRVEWGAKATTGHSTGIRISTAPLSETIQELFPVSAGLSPNLPEFRRSPITVHRFLLPEGTDLYQTVYFPDGGLHVYRASVTGRMLIVECVDSSPHLLSASWRAVGEAFGIDMNGIEQLDSNLQKFGKILPLPDDAQRKHFLFRLSHERNLYSLGRFATWRNILLDDVVDDIAVIKRLIRSGGAYELRAAY